MRSAYGTREVWSSAELPICSGDITRMLGWPKAVLQGRHGGSWPVHCLGSAENRAPHTASALAGNHPGVRPGYLSRPKRPVRASLPSGDAATVAAWEIGRFVIVVPTHPIVLVAAVAGHDLDDLTLAAGLADVGALNEDSVTLIGVHGEPPLPRSALASSDTAPDAATEPLQAGRALSARKTARGT
jgi:hypothetical protein